MIEASMAMAAAAATVTCVSVCASLACSTVSQNHRCTAKAFNSLPEQSQQLAFIHCCYFALDVPSQPHGEYEQDRNYVLLTAAEAGRTTAPNCSWQEQLNMLLALLQLLAHSHTNMQQLASVVCTYSIIMSPFKP
jgi:hypothetical protein